MKIRDLGEHGCICWATAIAILVRYSKVKITPAETRSKALNILNQCSPINSATRELLLELLDKDYKIQETKIRINDKGSGEHARLCWATANAILARYLKHKVSSKERTEVSRILKQCLPSGVRKLIFRIAL